MSWLDTKITVPVIVSVLTFLVLHYLIEPRKRKRLRLEERYKELYAPLYMIIISRIGAAGVINAVSKKDITLGYSGANNEIKDAYMIEFFRTKSGHASVGLIEAFFDYEYVYIQTKTYLDKDEKREERDNKEVTEMTEALRKRKIVTDSLVVTFIKECNQIKKKLNLEYDREELKTGIPKILKDIREKGSDKGI